MKIDAKIEFIKLQIESAFAITYKPIGDERGSLTRIWEESSDIGKLKLCEASLVVNPKDRTLRGLHFQSAPFSENKVIQCIQGKVFDVIVDLRRDSPTYKKHTSVEIGADCRFQGVFVPSGCAHGYLTLTPNSTLIYFMDNVYSPLHASGIRWNDPLLDIKWPVLPNLISEKDLNWPDLII
jgi:dTDP-4-dehydrorhamnose 3,5-epimerase